MAYRIPFLLPDCKIICCQYCCAEEHTIGYSVNRKSYCRNSIYSHAIHPSLSEPLILMWYCFCQLVLLLKQVVQIITVEQWQNSGIMNYDINIAKWFVECVMKFKLLGMTLTYQHIIHEEIKCVLNSCNTCSCSSKNSVFPSDNLKNMKVMVYWTIILLVICMGARLRFSCFHCQLTDCQQPGPQARFFNEFLWKNASFCSVLLCVAIFRNVIRTLNGNFRVSAHLPGCLFCLYFYCKWVIYWQLYNYFETVVRLK